MGKIFYIMGKSASGKDRIYSLLAAHKELNLKTVAFPNISTGAYRFPKKLAAEIAVKTILEHPFDGEVQMCTFSPEDQAIYQSALNQAKKSVYKY